MDLEYFDCLWEAEENFKGIPDGKSRQAWDRRAEDFNSRHHDERQEKILELLLEKGMLDSNSTVLDVGCGPGKFAIDFAQRAKRVVGVDISPKMLQYARENAAAQGLNNIEFKDLDWHSADLSALNWEREFSLVTAIMSPAIISRAGLEKIIAASKEYGLICHFVERHDSVSDRIKREVLGQNPEHKFGNTSLYCSFNVLWIYELFPEIVYFDLERELSRSVAEIYRSSIARFEMREELSEAQKTEIKNCLEKMADKNGIVTEKTTSKIACIFWKNRN
ncbi:MAG: class I SAM-dependent methyltransferase [Desulfitobacteriia bacterium]|jgi:SAM-dependent methyltransferase